MRAAIIKKIESFCEAERTALRDAKNGGRPVAASFCRFFPPELLAGLSLSPVRIIEGMDFTAEQAGETLVRPDVCPYCKSILGSFLERRSLHGDTDLVVGVITCDMMRRSLDILETEMHLPVFPVQLPATASANARDYFLHQVRRVVRDLSSYTGKLFSVEKAASFYSARKQAAEMLFEAAMGGAVSPLVLHRLLHLFSFARPDALSAFLSELLPAAGREKYVRRVAVIGSSIGLEDDLLPRMLEQKGVGYIPLVCSGLNVLAPYLSDEAAPEHEEDFIAWIAGTLFDGPPCIRQRPNNRVYKELKRVTEQAGCDGVILKCHKFCDLWFTEKQRMREAVDVPFLVLDGTFSESEFKRLENRIETFLEILG